ncbi:hypothetical protein IQ268_31325 [Oculatella sp. LEGE 06141]|uniref:hypothetical protein n=1 Tax=Oculatella sp. LEGE 06141 TaxID=1828648 RepID=UPI001880F947|nr:hypothetical protein [Oculatella sp. LEGE 06141]MBE9183028.1 hypothetical protein [Oculatella sp. LEGE 06141]
MTNASDCEIALNQFAKQDWLHWQGLPTCTLSTVAQMLPLSDGVGSGNVGEQTAHFHRLHLPGYGQPVRLWFTENEQVLLLDVAHPSPSASLETLLAQLGEPDAKLDTHWNVLSLPQSEWLYAQRGLALWINPENQVILHLAVFAPTTLEQYSHTLRLDLAQRRLPYRR